jgi:hypothetical protein
MGFNSGFKGLNIMQPYEDKALDKKECCVTEG